MPIFNGSQGNCCMTQGCLQSLQSFCMRSTLSTALCFSHGSSPFPALSGSHQIYSPLAATQVMDISALWEPQRDREVTQQKHVLWFVRQTSPLSKWPMASLTPALLPPSGQWMALSCGPGPGLSSLWIENELICSFVPHQKRTWSSADCSESIKRHE